VGNGDNAGSRKFTRREMVERLLNGMAAGAAWPMLASAHPIYEHLKNGAMLEQAAQLSKTAEWSPLFLSTAQNAELVALAECMVPGATKADVNRFIDLLLSVETFRHQEKFRASLAAIEESAKAGFGRQFSALNATEQESLLTTFSEVQANREHFENLKEWISGAYYSSEIGMRELGWDGNYAFASYPECERALGPN
jgi:hypothetical protein